MQGACGLAVPTSMLAAAAAVCRDTVDQLLAASVCMPPCRVKLLPREQLRQAEAELLASLDYAANTKSSAACRPLL